MKGKQEGSPMEQQWMDAIVKPAPAEGLYLAEVCYKPYPER